MVKDSRGDLRECSWEEAIVTVAKVLDSTPGDKLAAVAGGMADAEVREESQSFATAMRGTWLCLLGKNPNFCLNSLWEKAISF